MLSMLAPPHHADSAAVAHQADRLLRRAQRRHPLGLGLQLDEPVPRIERPVPRHVRKGSQRDRVSAAGGDLTAYGIEQATGEPTTSRKPGSAARDSPDTGAGQSIGPKTVSNNASPDASTAANPGRSAAVAKRTSGIRPGSA